MDHINMSEDEKMRCEMKEKLTYIGAIRFLMTYARKYTKHFLCFFIGWLFDTVITILTPAIFGMLIDEIVYYQHVGVFIKISLTFFLMLLFSCVLYFFIYAQHQYLMGMFTRDIRKDLYKHWQECQAEYLTGAHVGDGVTMIHSYSHECLLFLIKNVIHFSNGIIKLLCALIYLLVTNWKIGLLIMAIGPLSVYLNSLVGEKLKRYGYQQKECNRDYMGWIFEILSSLREIRMLGSQNKVESDLTSKQTVLFGLKYKTKVVTFIANNAISLINLSSTLMVYVISGILASRGQLTVGELLIFLSLFNVITDQIKRSSSTYIDSQNRISTVQYVYDFLKTPTEEQDDRKENLIVKEGRIEFKNVSFSYALDKTLINNLSLLIEGGQRLAIVGFSGCGKTTLINMLAGFYNPNEGNIYVDGQNIRACTVHSLRENIGIVSQDVYIFDGTIKENILFGKMDAPENEILAACKKANILQEILALPGGFETVIGENGTQLSGGQKQRIAMARTFLKNPAIIVFDEATSSLDEKTESAIFLEWSKLFHGRTTIVIAHQLKAVKLCDKVAILQEGKITSLELTGEIIEHNPDFQQLFALNKEN